MKRDLKSKSFVPVAKIKNALRRIHMHDKQRAIALKKRKVDIATYKCDFCNKYMYDGSSDKRFDELKLKYSDRNFSKELPQVDHDKPVIEPKIGFVNWDLYINSLWIDQVGYNILCKDCHEEKSSKEMEIRSEYGTLTRKK